MEIELRTASAEQFIDVTERVESAVRESSVKEGICIVHCLHTTAAIIINEFEPNIVIDYGKFFVKLVPKANYAHNSVDDNADAHLKSALLGPTQTIPIQKGKLTLGTWQRIIFCEFDGPRARKIAVAIR